MNLIDQHKDKLRFLLYLVHKSTGLIVCVDGLSLKLRNRFYMYCDHNGLTLDQMYQALIEETPALSCIKKEDLEIRSEISEA